MAKAPPDIRSLARKHTANALNVLAGIMNQADATPAARVMAANALIDRGWGKAHQSIELSGEVVSKVIRAPAVAQSTGDWAQQHVPPEHQRH